MLAGADDGISPRDLPSCLPVSGCSPEGGTASAADAEVALGSGGGDASAAAPAASTFIGSMSSCSTSRRLAACLPRADAGGLAPSNHAG